MKENRLTAEGFELDNGYLLEWPDDAGVIRRRDQHGNTDDVIRPEDIEYRKYRSLFNKPQESFSETSGTTPEIEKLDALHQQASRRPSGWHDGKDVARSREEFCERMIELWPKIRESLLEKK